MSYQALTKNEGILQAYYQVKEANPKRLPSL